MLKNTGAKFAGRTIYLWGGEERIADPAFLRRGKEIAARLHKADPGMVLQGGIFEWVTEAVNTVPVPRWVLKEFSQKAEPKKPAPLAQGGQGKIGWYFANTQSTACPQGFNQEETIKARMQDTRK